MLVVSTLVKKGENSKIRRSNFQSNAIYPWNAEHSDREHYP